MDLLEGKIVFLTGGNGILGTAITNRLVNLGAKIVSIDLINKRESSENIIYYEGDVTDRKSINKILVEIERYWGIPDVLINNAGIDSPPSQNSEANYPFEEVPTEVFEETLNVNCMGVVYCCQELGKKMKKKGGGSIINIGSIYGVLSPNHTIYKYKKKWFKSVAYSLSKSANINLTR